MTDNRLRSKAPAEEENGYGEAPTGAVGTRSLRGRQYPGGYGRDTGDFSGGVVDDGHGGPADDAGFESDNGHYSGYGAFGYTDRDGRQDQVGQGSRESTGPHRGRGPKGYQRSDDRIHEEVCERLTEDPFIDASDIEVEVQGREVRLSGTVASRGLRYRAEDLAAMVSGVVHVQNNLRARNTPE